MSWDSLSADIKKCSKCKLRAACTQVVPGEGNITTKVLLLGEGPGEKEDEAGIPFIGRSGQFLRQSMRMASLDDADVFITNVVRCRPPDNRDPEPEEIDACWEWTQKTLSLIRPKIIVTLGKYSLSTLAYQFGFSKKLGSQIKITEIAGKPVWVEDRHFYVYPMYHPSFAIRSRVRKSEFISHMKYLAASIPGWLERP